MSNDGDNITFRNRFLCRSCKKLLISKESLDTHIILCYESRLEKMKENEERMQLENKQYIEKLKKDYDEKIDDILEYMSKHIELIEKKHIDLNNYLINQIKTLSSL